MRLRRLKLLVTETPTGDQAGTDGSALQEVVLEPVELNEQGDRHCRLEPSTLMTAPSRNSAIRVVSLVESVVMVKLYL